ncbi:PREDICTED: keratin, type II cytoskeletal 1-like isoform X2 [Ipomoea nil]|uniref:keratin, type II cytoskeletal 1-like isoform X2 n=1 Tax=Ipomoea nil TaxID=35883 RepID=UPI00090092C6|nr:PREDICTED: keratin, type II cytoskeletal 1-like isoform X2 [Ipomoea nil]
MDRYQKVERPREETPMNENEIRITTQGRLRNYITYATSLLQEKGANEIALKAMGRAINKTVIIAELIKRRIAGLHQNTSIGSTDITDTWEPLEEGLLPLETIRHVSVITVTLSKNELDCSSPGYQPPIPSDQVKPVVGYDYERRPTNNGVVIRNDEDGGWEGERGTAGRGRGRGRCRGRGRGRGHGYQGRGGRGYGSWNDSYGASGAIPAQGGRGRGRGRGNGRGLARGVFKPNVTIQAAAA